MSVSDADAQFMAGMIHHHAQALVMSELAPTHGAGPAIRTLTARIINAQKDEIALMQRWLRDRERPVPEVDPSGRMVGMPAGSMEMSGMPDGSMQMPRMLSPQQLDELGRANGQEFDRLFLTYMIQHYNGAVTIALFIVRRDSCRQKTKSAKHRDNSTRR